MTVRSRQFFIGRVTSPASNLVLFTVPAGRTAILRDIRIYNAGVLGARAQILGRLGAGFRVVWSKTIPSQESAPTPESTVWVVFTEGENIAFSAVEGGPYDICLSGPLLLGNPT